MAPKAALLSKSEVDEKIKQYEEFINDKLRVDLQKLVEQRAKHQGEIEEFQELLEEVTRLRESNTQEFKSLVDIGCGVFCQAHVPDASRIFISIGLGFHVECTLEEAPRIIKLRQDALQKKVTHTVKQAAEVKAHIKFMVEAIRQLSGL